MISRRRFLELGTLAGASFLVPKFLKSFEHKAAVSNKKLVILELSGGNDGLNTLVPYRNDLYYRSRPTIAIPKQTLLRLNDEAGFHPALKGMKALYDDGYVSVINNVGYQNHSRSHFKSMDVWCTASTDGKQKTGWLGRYMDQLPDSPVAVCEIDNTPGMAVRGSRRQAAAVGGTTRVSGTAVAYPETAVGEKLHTVARQMQQNPQTNVYYLSHGSFDTHVGQNEYHARLLTQLDEAISAFIADLKKTGTFQNVMIVAFSEFGRRVAENPHRGTDHGAANNIFVISGALKKAGIYNELPDLNNLDEGDLKHSVDFRQIYATVLERWLDAPSDAVLQHRYDLLAFA